MHAQDERRAFVDGGGIVGRPRPVRRAHLAQLGARLPQNVRNAEAAADFYELSARNDYFPPGGERGQRQQHGGGVVVDDGRILRAGQALQQRPRVDRARAARAAGEVEFEVGIGSDGRNPLDGRLRQRRPAQVRMDDHAGGVDDRPQ